MTQQEHFGFGSIKNLKDILERENAKNVFLVTGRNSYETCGAKRGIEENLKDVDYERFCDFSPNPKIEEIEKGFGIFNERDYDCIMGIGGGSAIDVAKAIKLFDFQQTGEKIPLVAIPTTAGSGSEATYFIVYYIEKEKQSKGEPEITLPNYSICDPQFVYNLPKKIAASNGMDALSQAIESYWSIHSTNESKRFAEESVRLVFENLERAVNSEDKNAKEKMMLASNLAGKAINISKTTACHALAYPMTSYLDVPHGHAVGLTLGEMLKYNSKVTQEDCNDKRGAGHVKKTIDELVEIIGVGSVEEASEIINSLIEGIDLETRLSKLGVDAEFVIENAFNNPERLENNPRVLTEEGLGEILKRIC
ncbi:MAG: phosphonoacetaldehyde reductase [archaeon]